MKVSQLYMNPDTGLVFSTPFRYVPTAQLAVNTPGSRKLTICKGGSCNADNDEVPDTPYQSTPSYGCPVGKDSCPQAAGKDSVYSYMDYADDYCNTEFTKGQERRLQNMYGLYRA